MIFFTSDQHFGHARMVKNRKLFINMEEMDSFMIKRWNTAVSPADTVYILGDFSFLSSAPPSVYASALNGRKILIKGNHDPSWLSISSLEYWRMFFDGIYDSGLLYAGSRSIFLTHIPKYDIEQNISVCGHIHDDGGVFYNTFAPAKRLFNAGVDINNFSPVSFSELLHNNILFYKREYTKYEFQIFKEINDCLEADLAHFYPLGGK